MRVFYASYGSNLYLRRFLAYIKGGHFEGTDYTGCRDTADPLNISSPTFCWVKASLLFARCSGRWGGGGVCFLDALSSQPELLGMGGEVTATATVMAVVGGTPSPDLSSATSAALQSSASSAPATPISSCPPAWTLLRLHNLTLSQFNDVVRQENGGCTMEWELSPSAVEEAVARGPGAYVLPFQGPGSVSGPVAYGWYPCMVYLGLQKGRVEVEGAAEEQLLPVLTFTCARGHLGLQEAAEVAADYSGSVALEAAAAAAVPAALGSAAAVTEGGGTWAGCGAHAGVNAPSKLGILTWQQPWCSSDSSSSGLVSSSPVVEAASPAGAASPSAASLSPTLSLPPPSPILKHRDPYSSYLSMLQQGLQEAGVPEEEVHSYLSLRIQASRERSGLAAGSG